MKPEGSRLIMVRSFVQLMHAVLGKAWADVSPRAILLIPLHAYPLPHQLFFVASSAQRYQNQVNSKHFDVVLTVDHY